MSYRRIARPGYPVQLIDEGPSIGRVHFTRGITRGAIRGGSENPVMGSMATGESERQRDNRLSRESKARLRVAV